MKALVLNTGSSSLKFSLIEPRVEFLKNQRHIQVKGSLGFGSVSAVFGLSEAGRTRVRECLEQNQYVGPAAIHGASTVSSLLTMLARSRFPLVKQRFFSVIPKNTIC